MAGWSSALLTACLFAGLAWGLALQTAQLRSCELELGRLSYDGTANSHGLGVDAGKSTYILGFTPSNKRQLAEFLEGSGVPILAYVPSDSWLVLATKSTIESVQSLFRSPVAAYTSAHKALPEWTALLEQASAIVDAVNDDGESATVTAGQHMRRFLRQQGLAQEHIDAAEALMLSADGDEEEAARAVPTLPLQSHQGDAHQGRSRRRGLLSGPLSDGGQLPPRLQQRLSLMRPTPTLDALVTWRGRQGAKGGRAGSKAGGAARTSSTEHESSRAGSTEQGAVRYGISASLLPGLPEDTSAQAEQTWPALLQSALLQADPACPSDCSPQVQAGGSGRVLVYACRQHLAAAVAWLAEQVTVESVAPSVSITMRNAIASSITQLGGLSAEQAINGTVLAGVGHPYWLAGIDGTGEIVGLGDTGLDVDSCSFYDPAFPDIRLNLTGKGRPQIFQSDTHRKLQQYYALGDYGDTDGHGTHTSATVLGARLPSPGAATAADLPYSIDQSTGQAPGARLALFDMEDSINAAGARALSPPQDVNNQYLQVQYEAGARITSDSWGDDLMFIYNEYSRGFDEFLWQHPDAVSFLAAGNDGALVFSGDGTVSAPATAKNPISIGCSMTAGQASIPLTLLMLRSREAKSNRVRYESAIWPCFVEAAPLLTTLTSPVPVVVADPPRACTPLVNAKAVKGALLVVLRGACSLAQKLATAQAAGARGLLVVNADGSTLYRDDSSYCMASLSLPEGQVPDIPIAGLDRDYGLLVLSQLAAAPGTFTFVAEAIKYGADDLSDFSSFGPTSDGRIKPDLVAPGQFIRSATLRYDSAGQNTGLGSGNGCHTRTKALRGTSMSTPVAAGSAALVRQYFRTGFYPAGSNTSTLATPFTPSGMLIKAAMIGGAAEMTDGRALLAGSRLGLAPGPMQGFGRVSLPTTIPAVGVSQTPSGWGLQVVDMVSIGDGQTHTYTGLVGAGGQVRVTLTWYDYPAILNVAKTLVNDLDLLVNVTVPAASGSSSSNTTYLGNGGPAKDDTNNVERVSLAAVPAGAAITLSVSATLNSPYIRASLAQLPQRYALTVHGSFLGFIDDPANPAASELRKVPRSPPPPPSSRKASPPPARGGSSGGGNKGRAPPPRKRVRSERRSLLRPVQ